MSEAAKKLHSDQVSVEPKADKWNRRVLLVDDEVEILKAYEKLLGPKDTSSGIQSSRRSTVVPIVAAKRTEFEIVKASSFDEALEEVKKAKITNKPFAMAFFDVRLGEQRDGVELANEVKKIDSRIGIVFVTAYNDRSLDSIASVLGDEICDQWDFVNKPFNDNEIVQKARNLTALWNLRRDREQQEQAVADLNRRVLESERITSVAAVARGVTHEFGNLLMQIIGKAEISREKPIEKMQEAFDRIIDAGMRASEILDRFNNLSDNKSSKSEKTTTTLDTIIAEALDLMGHLFKKQNIKIDLDLEIVKGQNIKLHTTSVLQVFINLLINASHALDNQSEKIIKIHAQEDDSKWSIVIHDNGPGAPAELLDRLMEPLFTTKGPKGTGLGLAICKEILEIDHQGEFKIENAPQGGFKVTVSFNKEVIL